jgi:MoxR-like ATPase
VQSSRRAARGRSRDGKFDMAVRSNIVGIDSPEALEKALRSAYYLADEGVATAAYLALALGKPLLLEGAPGVGKTEAAKAIAAVLGRRLIRLQCYEGIDASAALYEWNYPRQMLAIRQAGEESIDIYGEAFLIERPMLAALRAPDSTVLLIDEIDRADDEFEAFLLELLSDFQVSIPELGTISATTIPHVVLTSNGTRELSDALRRRCLYHYVDYPDVDREARIIMARIDGSSASLSLQIARMVEGVRKEELRKVPGVAETLDWAAALVGIGVRDLHDAPEVVHETLMCLLKTHEDKSRLTREVTKRLLGKVA